MSNLQDGELPKEKAICKWCGREFVTFERIPGGGIRGRHYCCIEHTCKALAREKEETAKELEMKTIAEVRKESAKERREKLSGKKECPACGTLFRPKSNRVIFCERCKYIGWDKRNELMLARKRSMR